MGTHVAVTSVGHDHNLNYDEGVVECEVQGKAVPEVATDAPARPFLSAVCSALDELNSQGLSEQQGPRVGCWLTWREGISNAGVAQAMGTVLGVLDVLDYHQWSTCSGSAALNAHVRVAGSSSDETTIEMMALRQAREQSPSRRSTIANGSSQNGRDMNILLELVASVPGDVPVRSVLVGAHWTVVCSRHCGLASTLMDDHPHGHSQVRDVGRLHLKTARELAEYATSDNLLEASIGLAAINSMLEVDERQTVEGSAAEVLAERGRGKNVALVGHFPFIPELQEKVGRLWVIEQNPVRGEYPAEAAADLLPQADLVALTGTTLINQTFEGLVAHCRPDALVLVVGPSTPLSPILFDHGVQIISGALVQDENAVLHAVSQGANFRQLHQQGVRLVTIQK